MKEKTINLPELWMTKKLGDLCDIARGGSPRPIQQYLTNSPDGINWIKISDASASSKYIYETKEKIKPEGVTKSRLVQKDDFLLSNSMSFGRPYIMKTSGCIHDGWLVLKDKSGFFDQDYLYYFLNSQAAYKQFDNLAAGSTVRNLNTQLVKNVIIPIPPIEEQKRIVEILDKAFEGIAQAEANTRRNLINARELFDSYLDKILTDCRWETKQISECFRVKSGNFLPKNKMNNFGEFKVYGGNGVAGQHDQFNLEGKNILIGRVGAKCGNIKTINAKIWLTDNALYISEFLVDFDLDFLSFVLERADLGKTANQTAQPVISYTTIKSVFISYPKATEQQKTIVKKVYKIKDCLQDLEKIYQRKLEAIAELKQSILEKAFTGQLSQ